MRRRITEAHIKYICENYEKKTLKELAESVGLSLWQVLRVINCLRRNNVLPKRRKQKRKNLEYMVNVLIERGELKGRREGGRIDGRKED